MGYAFIRRSRACVRALRGAVSFPNVGKKALKQLSDAASRGAAAVEAEAPKVRRSAKKMSAAARKAVSDRMKNYWAKRRRAKKS